jgi:hypothetical protein
MPLLYNIWVRWCVKQFYWWKNWRPQRKPPGNKSLFHESELLESVQLEAARMITGLRKGTSHAKLYTELGWVTRCHWKNAKRQISYRILFLKAKELHHNSKLHFICITNFISFCFVIPLSIIVFLDLLCSMFYNLFAILVNYNS